MMLPDEQTEAGSSVPKPYSCATCGKQYQRNTHLRRHEATHVDSLRFKCQYCNKAFARGDVCRKHTLSCARKDELRGLPEFRRGQKPRACEACYHSKVMCDKASPCGRCASRQVVCRYREASEADSPYGSSPRYTASSHSLHKAGPSVANSSFLRGVINPKHESMLDYFANDQAINDQVPEMGIQPSYVPDNPPASGSDGIDFMPWSLISFMGDDFTDFSTDDSSKSTVSSELSATIPAFTTEGLGRLKYMSEEIVTELGKSHHYLGAYDPRYTEIFDADLARSVFSGDNLARFASIFLRFSHIHFPLVHIPTFGSSETPATLVLAVALGGTLRSAPGDDTLASRKFLTVAEDYCFRYFQGLLVAEAQRRPSHRLLHALQAACIVHNVQFMRTDVVARRRNLSLRLPALVAAARQLGLNNSRHSKGPLPWQQFVYEELCIRVAHWIAISDWHQAGIFHVQPQTSIIEMNCDLPCPLDVWDAKDQEHFERSLPHLTPPPHLSSVRRFVEQLMGDEWDAVQPIQLDSIRLSDMQAATLAISSVVVSTHLMGSIKAAASTLFRAVDRWQTLWDAIVVKHDAASLQRSGMARHAVEINDLIRKVVEAAVSGDERPAFLEKVCHDSLHALYAFILEH